MIRKIKLFIAGLLASGIIFFIFAASQLTKLRDSDILDIEFDEEDF